MISSCQSHGGKDCGCQGEGPARGGGGWASVAVVRLAADGADRLAEGLMDRAEQRGGMGKGKGKERRQCDSWVSGLRAEPFPNI